ncbi:MAG: exodeoxyribonuclease VII large subunit, partial [Elusimicrobia bacterium]|nr:exodeoxyribonuclease VII large subunit [Elusimicrobiota bacterium]
MNVAEARKALSVSQLTGLIYSSLEQSFPDVWVEGEVSDPRTFPSGHTYFTLKDEQSQLSAVLFKGDGGPMKFKLEHGLVILARGRVSMYRPRGQLQFIASLIQPKAAGALELAFQQLKAKLEKEGLFAPERKRPIPAFPERIGIVTSLQGAAIRDMLSVLRRRFDGLHIRIYPVPVQGEGAAPRIAEAIDDFCRLLPDTDVLLVGRGGGSLEDLWAFNEEAVARAIARATIPVISCVGHETDFTIADFVADLRAPTPSAAAELVVKNKAEVLEHLAGLG